MKSSRGNPVSEFTNHRVHIFQESQIRERGFNWIIPPSEAVKSSSIYGLSALTASLTLNPGPD